MHDNEDFSRFLNDSEQKQNYIVQKIKDWVYRVLVLNFIYGYSWHKIFHIYNIRPYPKHNPNNKKQNSMYNFLVCYIVYHTLGNHGIVIFSFSQCIKSSSQRWIQSQSHTGHSNDFIWYDLIFGVLTPLSTIFQLHCISWRPVLVVEEAGVPGENHRLWASNW
jgi:hypothetical protein